MASKRIDYIDYLKGLSIIWVVWYHIVHPWFVDFGFRMPLFFFASGIFFKVVDFKIYLRKKTNQLIVPFVFFSLIYYLYLISYIVLGVHEIYQTMFLIMFTHIYGEVNVATGLVQTIMTLLMLWPTINLMNRYIPMFVGKAEIPELSELFRKFRFSVRGFGRGMKFE